MGRISFVRAWAIVGSFLTALGTQACGEGGASVATRASEGVTAQPAPDVGCRLKERDGHQYWFCSERRSFDEAEAKCRAAGMALASVDDDDENDFIARHAGDDAFVGFTDRNHEGAWTTLAENRLSYCENQPDESQELAYTKWASHEPEDSDCRTVTRAGRIYWFCEEELEWDAARSACQNAGMSLVTIDDAGENAFVKGEVGHDTWLGGTDGASEGDWRWASGDSAFWSGDRQGHAVGGRYANWAQARPIGGTQRNCLEMRHSHGTWDDEACSKRLAWACEGAAGSAPESPDPHDCTLVDEHNERWSSVPCATRARYVCESLPPDAGKTLDELAEFVRDEYRSRKPRVSHVKFRDESSVTEPFLKYGERLGLRACVDLFEPDDASVTESGVETVSYRQTYQGVPLHTRGYTVQRDPQTKRVHAFTGRIEHGVSVDTRPSVSESQARGIAAARVGASAHGHSPSGELVILPTRQGPKPTWELGWLFSFPKTSTLPERGVGVSAKTGAILLQGTSIRKQCPSVDVSEPFEPVTLSISSFQQTDWGDPSNARGRRVQGADVPYALATSGLSDGTEFPLMYAQCEGESFPNVAALATQSITAPQGTTENHVAAAIYLAAQRCLEFLAAEVETLAGQPWIGFDGVGSRPIDIRMNHTPFGAFFDGAAFHFHPELDPYDGAAIELACHEIAHGVWQTQAGVSAFGDLETLSLNEGFASIIGSAAEMRVRGYPGVGDGGWCDIGDSARNATCATNLRDPTLSQSPSCTSVNDGLAVITERCPKDYGGQDYCPFTLQCYTSPDGTTPDRSCCDEHGNATVLSHWFYLLANGEESVNGFSCPYRVRPLTFAADGVSPDIESSVGKAVDILMDGISPLFFKAPNLGYEGIADATISAAVTRFGPLSPEAQSVAHAWYAVSVKENYFEGMPKVVPERNLGLVYPWLTFKWPVPDEETAWDFQIALGPFDGPVAFEESNITTTEEIAGQRFGTFELSLPFESTDRFYWRVRPHQGTPWADCSPIHSFIGTTSPEPVENIAVRSLLAPDGKVFPGDTDFQWDPVEGADEYLVVVTTDSDRGCVEEGGDAIVQTVSAEDGTDPNHVVTTIERLQPEETYYLNVRPIGPQDFQREPSQGECATFQFQTAPMRPPVGLSPDGPPYYRYGLEHPTLRWSDSNESASFDLLIYERTETGACESQAVTVGNPSGMSVDIDDRIFPVPNPTGYCWDVAAIAENGKRSARSDRATWAYFIDWVPRIDPGEQGLINQVVPGVIPGNSWDQPVDFFWRTEPFMWPSMPIELPFSFKHGRWPWDLSVAPDPATCFALLGEHACERESRGDMFRTVVNGHALTLDAELAGRGRYCWSIYPFVERLPGSGTPAARQPFIDPGVPYCYTTGPAPAQIVVESPADFTIEDGRVVFVEKPELVTGYIDLPYVPDKQITFEGTGDHVSLGECEVAPGPVLFEDFYDCQLPFEFIPLEQGATTIRVQLYNSQEDVPDPVLDLVQDVELVIETGCGKRNMTCCEAPKPKCETPALLACDNGRCRDCGGFGALCCQGNCDTADLICDGTRCVECGGLGEPCCDQTKGGVECDLGYSCDAENECAVAVCNEEVFSGESDHVVSTFHEVDVGSTDGRVIFYFNSFTVPDNFIVWAGGVNNRGEKLFESDCVGTENVVFFPPEAVCNGKYCCEPELGGACAKTIPKDTWEPPADGKVTVQIDQNCDGTDHTGWSFTVDCPN